MCVSEMAHCLSSCYYILFCYGSGAVDLQRAFRVKGGDFQFRPEEQIFKKKRFQRKCTVIHSWYVFVHAQTCQRGDIMSSEGARSTFLGKC